MFIKAAIILIGYLMSLYYFVTKNTILSAVVMGFMAGQVGVNIMHDGNHVAFSSNKTISYLMGYTLDLIFSCALVYRRSHVRIYILLCRTMVTTGV